MKNVFKIATILLATVLFESCYYDKAELLYPDSKVPCDTTTAVKFSVDILPVMNLNCNASGCHNATDASSGVILDNYAGIKTQAQNGRLMGSIDVINGTMPKGGAKLANCTITRIQQWIDSGTPNN